MHEDSTITDAEHELAWERNRALVARVRMALLCATAARAREQMRWHIHRRRRLVHELRVVRGVAERVGKVPGARRRRPRRARHVDLRAVPK